jgi:3-isopropylmalate/(R)-2-methylmalate dehydratase small subunit
MIRGKVWKFPDSIDTDLIIPACHLVRTMEEMKTFAMAPIRPRFAEEVEEGDIIVAGNNFGCGSSREQAVAVLKTLGIGAIVAAGFACIFYRNAVNLGLPVIECHDIYPHVQEGDIMEIDPGEGRLYLPESSRTFTGSRLPDFLMKIITDGGLIPHLLNSTNRK